jgi:hypothetical protein
LLPPAKLIDRHAAVINALEVMNEMWSPTRRAELAAFPIANPKPDVIIGANSVALAKIAGERTNGVNIRATHERASEILAAAKLAHENSGLKKPFTVSVWEHYDEALLRGDDPRLDVWRSWGVDRVILLMFKSVDFAALNRAAKFLN